MDYGFGDYETRWPEVFNPNIKPSAKGRRRGLSSLAKALLNVTHSSRRAVDRPSPAAERRAAELERRIAELERRAEELDGRSPETDTAA